MYYNNHEHAVLMNILVITSLLANGGFLMEHYQLCGL